MYLYYFLSISGFKALARPFAPLITVVQLLQMVVGATVTAAAARELYAGRDCSVTKENMKLGLAMYLSYLVLFAMLFHRNYLAEGAKNKIDFGCSMSGEKVKKRNAPSVEAAEGAVSDLCGTPLTEDQGKRVFGHGAEEAKAGKSKKKKKN